MLDAIENSQTEQEETVINQNSGNQQFLREWDQYQDQWLNSEDYNARQPILLPITVDIDEGVIARDRIKAARIAELKCALIRRK